MWPETIFELTLIVATLLCILNAGFLFSFAVVVMPGIAQFSDKDFIRAFQKIDGVIQKGQPLFGFVWLGSALALLIATVLGYSRLELLEFTLLATACVVYFVGIQVSTFAKNIPLNNKLQSLDAEALSDSELSQARQDFEPAWNKWNRSRTILSVVVSLLLLLLV